MAGLFRLLDNAFSYDPITRFLAGEDWISCGLWVLVKPTVHVIETDEGLLIFDDTLSEMPYSDENASIAWHSPTVRVLDVNFLNGLHHMDGVTGRWRSGSSRHQNLIVSPPKASFTSKPSSEFCRVSTARCVTSDHHYH